MPIDYNYDKLQERFTTMRSKIKTIIATIQEDAEFYVDIDPVVIVARLTDILGGDDAV